MLFHCAEVVEGGGWGGRGGVGGVELDELVGPGGDGFACFGGGEGLDGGAERGAFGFGEGDDAAAEDVGADLPPDGAFAAAAGEPDFRGRDAERAHAVQAVGEAEGDAFHGGAGHVRGGHGAGGEAVEDAGAARQVGRAFALEVGEEEEAVGAGRDAADGFVELRVRPAEEVARGFGGHGDVHGADEGQPGVGAVAEAGDFAQRDR